MNTTRLFIEPLELRIAPASVTVSYLDVDGDLVKIKATNSLPEPPPLDLTDLTFIGGGSGGQLALLDLTDAGFAGANIVFSVVKKPGGNGIADVGRIDATGVDLGTVSVKGDLGVIDAGSGAGQAIKSLTVRSMGVHGIASQGSGDLQSDIFGAFGSLTVSADVKDAFINVFGGTFATLGKLTIRGSLIGGAVAKSGSIATTGGMGPVTIGGDIIGGAGEGAGGIDVIGTLASVSLRGSLIGNSGGFGYFSDVFHEGQIFATGNIGPVKIGRDMIGGDGFAGGQVRSDAAIASVIVGGSLIGGRGLASGHICAEGTMGPVKIGGDIIGGPNAYTGMIEGFGSVGNVTVGGSIIGGFSFLSGLITAISDIGLVKVGGDLRGVSIIATESTIDSSGAIISYAGRIAGVSIGGSVITGVDASSNGALFNSAGIRAGNDIGFLTVKGSLIGNITDQGESPVIISARGQAAPSATSDIAIGKITIGGRVEHAQILAGYNGSAPANGNAQIGAVSVRGDWRASSLVAGVQDMSADGFGNADDVVIATPAVDALFSRIASVTIKGFITGTGRAGDQFGFTAQQIGSFKAGGITVPLTAAIDPPFDLALITGDVHLREV